MEMKHRKGVPLCPEKTGRQKKHRKGVPLCPEKTGMEKKHRKGVPLCPEKTGRQMKGEKTMKKAAALLMAAVLTLGLLAGCSGKPSDGETGTKGADAPAGTPAEVTEPEASADTQYKKDIRIGTLADLTVACRYAGTATVTTQTCNSTFNGLVAVDANGEASPELALEWSSNDDASEWTFKLREGVKFHDGSDFTAEDVKFT